MDVCLSGQEMCAAACGASGESWQYDGELRASEGTSAGCGLRGSGERQMLLWICTDAGGHTDSCGDGRVSRISVCV